MDEETDSVCRKDRAARVDFICRFNPHFRAMLSETAGTVTIVLLSPNRARRSFDVPLGLPDKPIILVLKSDREKEEDLVGTGVFGWRRHLVGHPWATRQSPLQPVPPFCITLRSCPSRMQNS